MVIMRVALLQAAELYRTNKHAYIIAILLQEYLKNTIILDWRTSAYSISFYILPQSIFPILY